MDAFASYREESRLVHRSLGGGCRPAGDRSEAPLAPVGPVGLPGPGGGAPRPHLHHQLQERRRYTLRGLSAFFTRYPIVFGAAVVVEALAIVLAFRHGLDVTFLNWLLAGTVALTFGLALKAVVSLFR